MSDADNQGHAHHGRGERNEHDPIPAEHRTAPAPLDEPGPDRAFLERLAGAPASETRRLLSEYVCALVAEFLHFEPGDGEVGPDDFFLELGFDSLLAVDFKILLEERLACPLQSTVLFDCATPDALVAYLSEVLSGGVTTGAAPRSAPRRHDALDDADIDALSADELRALMRRQTARLRSIEEAAAEPIAIVGMACRMPGHANTPEAFWKLQRDGVDAITEIPASRWDVDEYFDEDREAPGRMYVRVGGFVDRVDEFDAAFFGISPREAVQLDPQQRLMLEVTWEALEHAGISADALHGSPTGVFVGTRGAEYFRGAHPEDIETYYATGNSSSAMAGRLSYVLGLLGPCVAVDTACSSSLVALHGAVQSLRRGECSAALAGAVNLLLDPIGNIAISKASMLSPAGRCKTFDATADGYARSEGCGVVVLKRLSRAQADGDSILATIRGSAVNQDGASGGLTVPSGAAQQFVMRQALANAGAHPDDIGFIEAHGTGTSLGDPIEIAAIDAVFGPGRDRDANPLIVGSVKTNIGHLEPAAGIAGLIKVVQVFNEQVIPPHLHLHEPSPHIPWDATTVTVPVEATPWPRGERPRMAGISSFGFGGSNAHLILEEAPQQRPAEQATATSCPGVLCLSARSEAARDELVTRYRQLLSDGDASATDAPRQGGAARPIVTQHENGTPLENGCPTTLADVCASAATGRAHMPHRIALVAADLDDLRAQLDDVASGAGAGRSGRAPAHAPKIGFLFTGQGSQYAGMAQELYQDQPTFRAELDRCAELLAPHLEHPLIDVLWGAHSDLLSRTDYTQPCLFAVEYALARLWAAWGVHPTWVAGHSVGEYAAACLAGVFSLDDATRLIAARGRLMQQLSPPGAMTVVFAGLDSVRRHVPAADPQISIAAYNGPWSLVISGEPARVAEVTDKLVADGLDCRALDVSHAFHSPLMEPMLDAFAEVARSISYTSPRLGFVSNLQPGPVSDELTRPDYWVRHVREPVRFGDGITALAREHCDVLIEIGPAPTLIGMAQNVAAESAAAWLPSLRRGHADTRVLLDAVAELYVRGAPIDWEAFHREGGARRVALPTYPFQRSRFWLDRRRRSTGQGEQTGHRLLGGQLSSATLAPGQLLFESAVREDDPPLLADHRAYDTAIMPAAAYLEWALAAGQRACGSERIQLTDVVIEAALALTGDDTTMQLLLTPGEGGGYGFELFSCASDRGSWTTHATGSLHVASSAPSDVDDTPRDLDTLRDRCDESIDVAQFYDLYEAVGLSYGPGFRVISSLQRGAGEALARIRLPEVSGSARGAMLHPALLDGCFQACRTLALQRNLEAMYLPVAYERVTRTADAGDAVWCHVRLRSVSDDERVLVQDLQLLDDDGHCVAEVHGLSLVQASRAALSAAADPLKTLGHGVHWSPSPLDASAPDRLSGNWLVVSDASDVGTALVDKLAGLGANVQRVSAADVASAREGDAKSWDAVFDALDGHCEGVVHMAALDERAPSDSGERYDEARQHAVCGSALALITALAGRTWTTTPQVFLVTRGAAPADDEPAPLAVSQSTLWGLGAVLALEHPEWRTRRLDLPTDVSETDVDDLLLEVTAGDDETQVAWRTGVRRVARLVRTANRARQGLSLPDEPWHLRTSDYGVLENLGASPAPRRAPGHGEVEIEVAAAALNFKDVLTALGMLREQAEAAGILSCSDQPLGLECAGRVVAIGDGVTRFAVGDEVVASAFGALASHVTTRQGAVFPKAAGISFEQAASLPTVFLTALYGLEQCAHIGPDDTVLVHAAAGGVGQAALQVARRAGARVFATASPGKWGFLESQGVEHVLNSRSLDFADELLALTGGRGVDIVLNSLAGEHIPASLRCLADGGRFVEIGKLGIWTDAQVAAERPDVSYTAFDMVDVTDRDPALLTELQQNLAAGLSDGTLQPPPIKTFALTDAVAAFSWLAQAKNIGKVVLSVPRPGAALPLVRADRSYLVTGGLGALGLSVARWLVDSGARHVVLCGRSTPTPGAEATLHALRDAGATVVTAQLDVTDRAAVADVIGPLSPALGGVIHAAGVIDDGLLMNLDWERFARVLAPKLAGAWNLHELTADLPLDFFVCFSSMVGVLGNAGQGSYAAANASLDALAWHRRALGLPAVSIDWGPWSGAGMAAESADRNRARFAEMGLGTIAPDQGLAVLERILGDRSHTQVAVLPITWPRFLAHLNRPPPFLALMHDADTLGSGPNSSLIDDLAGATPDEMSARLMAFLREQLARVMGFASPSQVDPELELIEMGIDSLLAVDLRNRIETSLGCSLPATLLFDHPNLVSLVASLTERLLEDGDDDDLLAGVEGLTDDEVARLLAGEDLGSRDD